jgi:hypothetical protein
MTNPNISIYNHATGETEIRPMTDEEFAFSQQSGEVPADFVPQGGN